MLSKIADDRNWNRTFWLLFVVAGASLIAMEIAGMFFLDIVAGLIIIVVGSAKLVEEFSRRRMLSYQNDLYEKTHSLAMSLEELIDATRHSEGRNTVRHHTAEKKRIDMDIKIENNYRELVRKMIDVENKLSRLSREAGPPAATVRPPEKKPSASGKTFPERVVEKARLIPSGRVASCSDIARASGRPRKYQMTGRILSECPKDIPSHRIVGKDGSLASLGMDSKSAIRKKAASLRKEGVAVEKGKVSEKRFFHKF